VDIYQKMGALGFVIKVGLLVVMTIYVYLLRQHIKKKNKKRGKRK